MNHYFLIASLPMLHFGQKPPLRPADFLTVCGENLAPEEMAVLNDLLDHEGAQESHAFSREWRDRETELRNAVVRQRARLRLVNPDPFIRPSSGMHLVIQAGVAEAFQAPDPLKREEALDRLRWRLLEELAGLNPFSFESVLAYGLRLRLVWKWAELKSGAGLDALETAVAETVETASGKTILEEQTQKAGLA